MSTVDEQYEDIQKRLAEAKLRTLEGKGTTPPMWDDVVFLIEQLEGWRAQAGSWARRVDDIRAGRA